METEVMDRDAPSAGDAAGDLARTLAETFLVAARQRPQVRAEFISDSHPASVSLAELEGLARRAAGGLTALGVGPGDVVAVQTPNWLETLVAHAAVALVGAVVLPIVHIYGPGEVAFIIGQSGAKVLITPRRWQGKDYVERLATVRAAHPVLKQVVLGDAPEGIVAWSDLISAAPLHTIATVAPDDVAMLIYTSGTTSDPKGVQHSHRTLLAELHSAPEVDPDEASLSPWPPGHVAGVLAFQRFWLMARPAVYMERWDASEAARLIKRYGIISTGGTPFHLTSLLDAADAHGYDISGMTDYMAGATMIPPSLIARCEARGLRTYRCYGMSEHPTISRGAATDPADKRFNTDGRLCPGVEVRIVDDDLKDLPVGEEGEILSRGPDRFIGYRDPALNEGVILDGGWLRTGDIGRLDAEGYLAITDRKKDIIIRGGENIASREVEDILLVLPGVREAAVVGAPHPMLGERVCAFLVLEPGVVVGQEEVSQHFAASGVARQKTPEKLVIIDELPRNAAGKVLKPELRKRLKTG